MHGRAPHFGFDMDGTLINTFDFFEHSSRTAFEENGIDLPVEEFRLRFGTGMRMKDWFPQMGITDQRLIDSILRTRDDVMIALLESGTAWMDGAPETLEALRRRQESLCIVTNANKRYVAAVRRCLPDIDTFVTELIGPDSAGMKNKPDPSGILYAISVSNRGADEFIYAGDQLFDYEAARNARTKFCALMGAHTYPEAAEKADLRIRRLPELLEL